MDRTTLFKKLILIGAAVAAIAFQPDYARAQPRWVTISSFNDVRRMKLINDSLYVATSGGLLVIADPNKPGRTLTNVDGLGTTDLTDIIVDSAGQTWITGAGRLIKFGDQSRAPYLFFDNNDQLFRLLCVVDDGDFLWIGSELGLILFSKSRGGGQIQDSYTQFGSLNASPAVQGIFLQGDSLWVATSAGLAVTDRRDKVRMKSPAAWTSFNLNNHPELGTSNIRRVVAFESNLYIATDVDAFRLDRSPSDTVFTVVPIGQNWDFTDLKVENDTLFFYFGNGLGCLNSGNFAYVTLSGLPGPPQTGLNTGSYRWVGERSVAGIYQNSSGSFVKYSHTGLPTNDINDIAVDRTGAVTALLGRGSATQLVDSAWVLRNFSPPDVTTLMISDSSNLVWAGTFGDGLWRIAGDSIKQFNQTNSTMRGNTDGPAGVHFVVIRGLATDGHYLFTACYRALNGYPVAFCDLGRIDSVAAWDSLGIANGIIDTFVSTLDYQNYNLIVGTETNGLYWYYTGPDPYDKRDDSCRHLNNDNSFLRSDVVRKVKFGPDGTLWVGTNFGLSRYDSGIDQFVDINLPAGIGPDITDIEFDSRGNAWVSAHNGLARFDATAGAFELMTSLNSGLVADDIRNITLDNRTGNLWVATGAGISLLTSAIAKPTQRLDSVLAFPNPFVINSGTEQLKFNFARPGTIRIFDVSGAHIIDLPVNSSWDGRNQSGKAVASGVYIFVLTDENGQVARGKFLLVNRR